MTNLLRFKETEVRSNVSQVIDNFRSKNAKNRKSASLAVAHTNMEEFISRLRHTLLELKEMEGKTSLEQVCISCTSVTSLDL
jgi:hypothetical protein